MKKKVIFACLLISVLIAVAVCLILVTMSKKPSVPAKEPSAQEETPSSPDGSDEWGAQKALASLNGIMNSMQEEQEDTPAFIVELEKRNKITVEEFTENEEGAAVTVTVKSPDLYGIAKKIDQNNEDRSKEELLALIDEELKKADIIEKTLVLEYVKTDNGYVPIITSEFLDAYYGGVFRLYDDLISNR
ncbi:MAG: hypothetical protein E7616_08640 [Ruminococcaceae bacterium]|nr:hypothetical protein [Oscillospiraceae bacterium]